MIPRVLKSTMFLGIVIGFALALIAGASVFVWNHWNDHALFHQLVQIELQREQAQRAQQQPRVPLPTVTTPPVASSPVPDPKPADKKP